MQTELKLLKKGIKINGKYYPCFYSSSKHNINGNATIYIKTYERIPDEARQALNVQNDSDSMTDYFEQDRIRIAPTSPYYDRVNELAAN